MATHVTANPANISLTSSHHDDIFTSNVPSNSIVTRSLPRPTEGHPRPYFSNRGNNRNFKQALTVNTVPVVIGLNDFTNGRLRALPQTVQRLSLSDCLQVNDESLTHLKSKKLSGLSLDNCYQITDKGLEHLKGMPLKQLDLTGCKKITIAGLIENLKGMPLEYLGLDKNPNITPANIKNLEQTFGLKQQPGTNILKKADLIQR